MSEKNGLILEVLSTKWGKFVRVKEQTRIGTSFHHAKLVRYDSCGGISLCSLYHPGYDEKTNIFYVRGIEDDKDFMPVYVNNENVLDNIRMAVDCYNNWYRELPVKGEPEPKHKTDWCESVEVIK
jgi:hypothetical protein